MRKLIPLMLVALLASTPSAEAGVLRGVKRVALFPIRFTYHFVTLSASVPLMAWYYAKVEDYGDQ